MALAWWNVAPPRLRRHADRQEVLVWPSELKMEVSLVKNRTHELVCIGEPTLAMRLVHATPISKRHPAKVA
jgi:hypothetical protein